MAVMNLNFAQIADEAFINILGAPGVVKEGVVYKFDEFGNEVATDTPEADIKAEIDRVRTIHQYRNERANLYPNLEEQLDLLWHAMDADESKRLEPFYSTIKAIKDAYPKDCSNNSELVVDESLANVVVDVDLPEPPPVDFEPPLWAPIEEDTTPIIFDDTANTVIGDTE